MTTYNNFMGTLSEPPHNYEELLAQRPSKPLDIPQHEYDHVRYGLPSGVVDFEKTRVERELLISHYFKYGYDSWPASALSSRFRKHVALFRASLDLYEVFSTTKVFCKDELYVRCLKEGPSFTEFIKKARSTCLRAKTSETITEIEEEYYFEEYDGYNSIIDQRYLIHWDDRADIDDIKYAFIPAEESRTKDFQKCLDKLWKDFRLDECEWPSKFDMIGAMKNTKMYDPTGTGKTALMREFWSTDIDPKGPYFAKRSVVPTHPGSTRDTGVGDPGTILKVKQLNALARAISERLPYSANAPGNMCNARLKRVLKKNLFLHLDFKKFGLTFPRALMNALIRKIAESSGMDLDHLIINEFYVEIDGETYSTERGTMLGWLDAINSICVSAILHSMTEELCFDFITFNDDVEISKRSASAHAETLELLRGAVIAEMDSYDIPISLSKTYGSKASVFLERYVYYQREYGLDMYKEQLTVAAYAKSLVTEFPWEAKMFFAAAEQWTKSAYATDRCIDTCPIEFRKEEKTLPLWAGGWYIRREKGLDTSLKYCDQLAIRLGMELSQFRPPKYSTPITKVSSEEKIANAVQSKVHSSYSSAAARLQFDVTESRRSINSDLDLLFHSITTRCDTFQGNNQGYAEAVHSYVTKHVRAYYDTGQ
jgi:hypothetical protein